MPVEINEAISPIVFWRKELRPGSGGEGRYRGGHGQIMEIGNREGLPFNISATYERTEHHPRGREGGGPGALGRLYLKGSGEEVTPLGRSRIPAGERLVLEFPGGGGFGPPEQRDPEAAAADERSGLG
jgi:N-methylhydantoinase B